MIFYVQFREDCSFYDKLMRFDDMDRNLVFETVIKEYGSFVHRILSEREAQDLIPEALVNLDLVEFGEPCFSTKEDDCSKSGVNWFIDTFKFNVERDTPVIFNKTVGGNPGTGNGGNPGTGNGGNPGTINGDWNKTVYDEPPNYSKRITKWEIHDDWYEITLSPSPSAGISEPVYDLHVTNAIGNQRKIRDIRTTVRAFGIESNGTIEDLSPYDPYVALETNETDLQNGTNKFIGHGLLSDLVPFVYNGSNRTINEPAGTSAWNFTPDYREFHAQSAVLITRRGYRNWSWMSTYPDHWRITFVWVAVLYGNYDKWIILSKPLIIKSNSYTNEYEAQHHNNILNHTSYIKRPDFWQVGRFSTKDQYTSGQQVKLVRSGSDIPTWFTFGNRFTEGKKNGTSISPDLPLSNKTFRSIWNNPIVAPKTKTEWHNFICRRVFVEQGLFNGVILRYKQNHRTVPKLKGKIKVELVLKALGLEAARVSAPVVEEHQESFVQYELTSVVHPEVDEIWMEITIEEKTANPNTGEPWSDALSDIEMIGVV